MPTRPTCLVGAQAKWTMNESPAGRQVQGRPSGVCKLMGLSCRGDVANLPDGWDGSRGSAATDGRLNHSEATTGLPRPTIPSTWGACPVVNPEGLAPVTRCHGVVNVALSVTGHAGGDEHRQLGKRIQG